jgi:transcriptional regulator with GAF, ATPase, and Fis domain
MISRVGAEKDIKVDVRVIAATNKRFENGKKPFP